MLGKKEEEKECRCIKWILIILGAITAIGAISFAVYKMFFEDKYACDDLCCDDECCCCDDFENEEF